MCAIFHFALVCGDTLLVNIHVVVKATILRGIIHPRFVANVNTPLVNARHPRTLSDGTGALRNFIRDRTSKTSFKNKCAEVKAGEIYTAFANEILRERLTLRDSLYATVEAVL